MEVKSSQIISTLMKIDISNLVDAGIPSEDELYKPMQNLFKDLDLFSFLKPLDMSAIFSPTSAPKGFRLYSLLSVIHKSIPVLGFITKNQDISIIVHPNEIIVNIQFEEDEDDGEDDEEDEDNGEDDEEIKTQLIEKVSTNLKILMSVLYHSKRLEGKENSVKIPIRMENKYKLDVEDTQGFLAHFSGAVLCDSSIGTMTFEKVTIRVEEDPKNWTRFTISTRKDSGSLHSEHTGIVVSLKEIDIDSLIEKDINRINAILSN